MNARIHRLPVGASIAVAIASLLCPAGAVFALSLTVTSTLDEPAADPTVATCISTPSGLCTLRAAIMVTNFYAGPNSITVPAGTYTLTRPGYDDNALVGDLDIAHDLVLQGAGSAATIIDGNAAVTSDRVFQVLPSAQYVALSGITIRNGKSVASNGGVIGGGGLYIEGTAEVHLTDVIVDGNTAVQQGGGIYANFSNNGGSLAMDHVVVRNNTLTSLGFSQGGGISIYLPSQTSQATLQDCQIYGNTVDGNGGGIYTAGTHTIQWTVQRTDIYSNTAVAGGAISTNVPLTLSDSRLHDNQASLDGGAIEAFSPLIIQRTSLVGNTAGRFGGALFDSEDTAIVNASFTEFAHVEQSTLSGNVAQYGGGIYHDGSLYPSILTVLNSTISGNVVRRQQGGSGTADGGGIAVYEGMLNLLNSTVANNRVQLGTGLNTYTGDGGGLFLCVRDPMTHVCASTPSSGLTALSSVIANNTRGNGLTIEGADDCYSVGVTGSLGYVAFGTIVNCSVTGPNTDTISGLNPLLTPLQDNGGPTRTHALRPGSVAINNGALGGCTKDPAGVIPLTVDQRGATRPYPAGGRCDMGAFELGAMPTLDIDASNPFTKYDASTDGLLILRYLFGHTGTSLTSGALGGNATRTDPAAVKDYLDNAHVWLDVDNNGTADALTDGILILRYMYGLRGDALINGAVDPAGTRKTAAAIVPYLQSLMP